MVAAWIRALTGVGPSIASGSQTWSGNWALLPTAPAKRSRAITVICHSGRAPPMAAKTSLEVRACRAAVQIIMMPSPKPKSPTRLTMNAFLAAPAAEGFLYQKPMSR